MKKIISSFFLLLIAPFRRLRKIRFDSFVGGLVFGAIFSLVVNIVTVNIQETMQKQRILEALENEILSNTLMASNSVGYINKLTDEEASYNPFYVIRHYDDYMWKQSLDALKYVSQLDQETQILLSGYYSTTLPLNNGVLQNLEELTNNRLEGCSKYYTLDEVEEDECDYWNEMRNTIEQNVAISMSNEGFKVLEDFHPTQDRLNSIFLRALLGGGSMRILSGD